MIFIRVDANEQIASGHMMRCRTIAYELERMGKQITFLVSDRASVKLLEDGKFPYQILNTLWSDLNTAEEIDCMKGLLARSRQNDNEIPVLFVDSYYVTNEYFRTLKEFAKIIFMDDLAEDTYDVDVLINYNITYEKHDYFDRYKGRRTKLILGPSYVPLRRQFGEDRAQKTDCHIHGIPKVLLMCGGGDSENAIYHILHFLSQQESFDKYCYNVVAGVYNPHLEAIKELVAEHSNINLLYNVSNMADVMKANDLAIVAASTVLYECCAVGLPTAFFIVADNQKPDAEVFSEKCDLIYLGDFRENREKTLRHIKEALEKLSEDGAYRHHTAKKMREIVDGKGSQRIANIMDRMFEIGSFYEEETELSESQESIEIGEFSRGGGVVDLWNDGRTAIASVINRLPHTAKGNGICFLPEYTCDTVILPFKKNRYKICFYKINRNLCIDVEWFEEYLYKYKPDVVLLHPYYGCNNVDDIYEILRTYKKGNELVVIEDLTQSLFLYDTAMQRADFVVGSLRKWFGVPEGGFSLQTAQAVDTVGVSKNEEKEYEIYSEYVKMKQEAQRLKRLYLRGEFIEKQKFLELNGRSEQLLYAQDSLFAMSGSTKHYLRNADIERKREQRKANARILWDGLRALGIQSVIDLREDSVPLYMPIYDDDRESLQDGLRANGIYAPVLWPMPDEVSGLVSDEAGYVYGHLLALPCDHRYREVDIRHILDVIKQLRG